MFKVGIIGVRPRQFAMLQGHGFKYIEISCYDAKKMTPESVANFCRDLDRIVLLQTGAPKTAYMGAPKDRLQILRNSSSISSVVRALNTIEAEQAFAHESASTEAERFEHQGEDYSQSITQGTVVEPVKSEPAPSRVAAKEAVRLVSEVPAGHVSQYALPKFEDEYVVSLPNSGGEQSYQILLAAMPGDIIRFARPEGLPLEKWQWRIRRARAYYLKKHNMLIEAHYFADFVDLKVMDPSKEEVAVVTDTLNLAPPAEVEEVAVATTVAAAPVTSAGLPARADLTPHRPRLEAFEVLREAKEKGLFTTPVATDSETKPQSQDPDKGVHVTTIPDGMSAAEMDFADEEEVEEASEAPVHKLEPEPPVRSARLGNLAHTHAGAYFSGLDSTVFPEGVEPPAKNVIHHLKDPNLHTPPAPTPEVEKQVSTELENKFWRKVFFHFLNQGMKAADAADQADEALTRYRKTL